MAFPRMGLTGYVLAAQGIFGIINGAVSITSSSVAQDQAILLEIPSIPAIHAIALGTITIG